MRPTAPLRVFPNPLTVMGTLVGHAPASRCRFRRAASPSDYKTATVRAVATLRHEGSLEDQTGLERPPAAPGKKGEGRQTDVEILRLFAHRREARERECPRVSLVTLLGFSACLAVASVPIPARAFFFVLK